MSGRKNKIAYFYDSEPGAGMPGLNWTIQCSPCALRRALPLLPSALPHPTYLFPSISSFLPSAR